MTESMRTRKAIGGWTFALGLVAMLFVGIPQTVLAQPADARGYVAVRAGLNAERSEDNLTGNVLGGGASVGFGLGDAWSTEVEVWYPQWIRTDSTDGRHRDTLVAVAFRRMLPGGRVRPYLLVGGTAARTETQFTSCAAIRQPPGVSQGVLTGVSCSEPDVTARNREIYNSLSLFGLVGAGAEIAVGRRVRLMPDVRADLWLTAVIVRPSLAVAFVF
jgi:hypothetical protein